MRFISKFTIAFSLAVLLLPMAFHAQSNTRRTARPAQPAKKPVIFAVLRDGAIIEPIAHVEDGKLVATVGGDSGDEAVTAFNKTFYPSGSSYSLIFGGAKAGTVAVKSSNPTAECAPNIGNVTATSSKAKLKGMVMALATNITPKKAGSGVRRLPTWPERNELDVLIREKFSETVGEIKKLDYHNLTALDLQNDKKPEFVGSFWVENDPKTRTLMFFVAEPNAEGKLELTHTDLRTIKEDEVMSGEISALDDGVYHELLLDVFDYDGDGLSEIFTYVQAFEGSGFNVYSRVDGKWTKVFEGYNYHCGY